MSQTTTTDPTGHYSFTGVTGGTSNTYTVGITPPPGFTATLVNQGGDPTKDSDLNPLTSQSTSFTLAPGTTNNDIDLGLKPVCEKPILTVGNAACTSTTSYSVAFYTSATSVTASGGTIDLVNRRITGITSGQPVSITASNGTGCATVMTVASPASCSVTPDPNGCKAPNLTVGQPICNGSGFYTVSFTLDGPGSVSASAGSVSGNTIINIPISSTPVTVSAVSGTCVSSVSVMPPTNCGVNPCENPAITLSGPVCSTSAVGTYVVNFTVSAGTTVTPSAGVVSGNQIINVGSGVPLSLTVTATGGCAPKVVTISPASCTVCNRPTLTVGNPTCTGTGSYSVSFYSSSTAVTASAGQFSGTSGLINISLSDSVVITAGNGSCTERLVVYPPTSCPPAGLTCISPNLSIGQPICNGNGTYTISYDVKAGFSVTASAGVLSTRRTTLLPQIWAPA
ncbi:SdrD B-like domain-containing protein [Spirosoma telluris]|uniref:SdrD B-like domain-containing protein n=1 Tax=Spirosoma telluris TaxID=2183553 RepID=UPI0012F909D8